MTLGGDHHWCDHWCTPREVVNWYGRRFSWWGVGWGEVGGIVLGVVEAGRGVHSSGRGIGRVVPGAHERERKGN